jgi:hypothetical protein
MFTASRLLIAVFVVSFVSQAAARSAKYHQRPPHGGAQKMH